MTPLEMLATALGGGGLATGLGVVGKVVRDRLRARRESASADATVERSRVIAAERVELATMGRDERTEQRLWERLESVEAETEKCRDGREEDRRRHEEERRRDRDACDKRVEAVEQSVSRVAARVVEIRRSTPGALVRIGEEDDEREDTALHELEEIARR